MNINDTVPYFLNHYEPAVSFLRTYYAAFPDIFKVYFSRHCKDTEERHLQSIRQYSGSFAKIRQVHECIASIIEDIAESYCTLYAIDLPVDVHLIVGGFGSNAYMYYRGKTNLVFALEKLSSDPDHLKAIVAHEFGHAVHHILSERARIDWSSIRWDSPLVWLFQEGAATYFSRQAAGGLRPSVYFSYDEQGCEWLAFTEVHKEEIKAAFAEACRIEASDSIYREWFSILGGAKFGRSRLGYFLGDWFMKEQVARLGERDAVTLWNSPDFEQRVKQWLDWLA